MASTAATFAHASRQITLYAGQSIFLAGVLGGSMNLIVFLSLKTFRQSSCAFYFMIMSFVNMGQLITGYLTRIMITGYNMDWTQMSLIYCKLRWFLFQSFTLMSYACMCFATIDQYLATSNNDQWRQWSNIRIAHRVCVFVAIPIIIHGIPSIIYFDHIESSISNHYICLLTNSIYLKYRTYGFNVFLGGALPVLVTIVFGLLAFKNIQQLAYRTVPLVRRKLDKQLTIMVLVQVIYICVAIIPYTIVIIIMTNLNLQNAPLLAAELQLAESISAIIYYSYFAAPFYIYICVSRRFRRQIHFVVLHIYHHLFKEPTIMNNRVLPSSDTH